MTDTCLLDLWINMIHRKVCSECGPFDEEDEQRLRDILRKRGYPVDRVAERLVELWPDYGLAMAHWDLTNAGGR